MFFEHVNLTVSDIQRSTDFYRSLFGFEVRWRGKSGSGQPAVHVGNDRNYLALFESADGEPAEYDYNRVGLNHFGIVVKDLEAMRQRLLELGTTPELVADYDPGRRLYFRDPDGIEVELVEYDGQ